MNFKNTAAILLLASTILFSCTKSSSDPSGNAPANATNLQITVYDNGTTESGATVYLFASQTDWQSFAYSGTPTYLYNVVSDNNGVAAFINIPASTYYWLAEKKCDNSIYDSATTAGILTEGITNTSTATMQGEGSIQVVNTGSLLNANIVVDGKSYGKITPGNSLIIPFQTVGLHAVTATNTLASPVTQNASVTDCAITTIDVNLN